MFSPFLIISRPTRALFCSSMHVHVLNLGHSLHVSSDVLLAIDTNREKIDPCGAVGYFFFL